MDPVVESVFPLQRWSHVVSNMIISTGETGCEMMGRFLTSGFFSFLHHFSFGSVSQVFVKVVIFTLEPFRSTRKSSNLQTVAEFMIHMILGFSMITDQMRNHTKRRVVMEHLGHVCSTHASTNTTGICLFVTGQTADPISPPPSGSGEETRRRRAGDG